MKSQGCINVSVANLYAGPTYHSDIVTQGILGEQVEILEKRESHLRIRQADDYTSWISRHQICEKQVFSGEKVTVRSHVMRIYAKPDESSPGVRDAVTGCRLTAVSKNREWIRVILPDGITGWARKKHFGGFPAGSGRNAAILAREFLGYPYFWGGNTPRGMDCSGFVQRVYALLGHQLPRDAWMQKEAMPHLTEDPLASRPGDLIFFGEDRKKVDHVGISLGRGRVIHSRGMIRIDSMDPASCTYRSRLTQTFIATGQVYEPRTDDSLF